MNVYSSFLYLFRMHLCVHLADGINNNILFINNVSGPTQTFKNQLLASKIGQFYDVPILLTPSK